MSVNPATTASTYLIHVSGLVQGVGFRPFIYRLAVDRKLTGWVINRNDGVVIKTNATQRELTHFTDAIFQQAPLAASVHNISYEEVQKERFTDFRIKKSTAVSDSITLVSPDIAVCKDCLRDMQSQEHRIAYPFINCTHCGPRFSIINGLPYDRKNTSMDIFPMCELCSSEYNDVLDRRFHAQPIACNSCGPHYTLHYKGIQTTRLDEIFAILSSGIFKGEIFAIKGTGGFHLACDAFNQGAVLRLREIKNRDEKPFAILCKNLDKARLIAKISQYEEELLLSWQRPIVLLKSKSGIADAVCNSLDRVGILLPYMPFHFQLFEKLQTSAIVLTSGNFSDEPIVISNKEALQSFSPLVSGVLTYNRDIINRVDDSVVKTLNKKTLIIRSSRGYTPSPILTRLHTEGIFAAGAELVNSFAIGKGNQAIMSQYIGDLKNFETMEFYEESYRRFKNLFNFKPQLVVADLHPEYLSTIFAERLAAENQIELIKVQHHHAHIASVMADRGLDQKLIGISLDGLGLGDNHMILGAELMLCSLESFERLSHYRDVPMPGGDQASKQPWRMALSYLYEVYGTRAQKLNLPVFMNVDPKKVAGVFQMLENDINCPKASSAGRLFDAVAALTGVCYVNSYQAEAPMRLESCLDQSEIGKYTYHLSDDEIDFTPMIEEICRDVMNAIPAPFISARFHNTQIDALCRVTHTFSQHYSIKHVILSGGSFQNHYLVKHLTGCLSKMGMEVILPESVPVNDQGIALGQLAIAAKRRSIGLI